MLLLLFGEAEFRVEHVLWAYEMAETHGEGFVHVEFGLFPRFSLAVFCLLRRAGWSVVKRWRKEEPELNHKYPRTYNAIAGVEHQGKFSFDHCQ